jgi:hypothetical protein
MWRIASGFYAFIARWAGIQHRHGGDGGVLLLRLSHFFGRPNVACLLRTQGVEILRQAPNIWIGGTPVLVTWDAQNRPWCECPGCRRRCRFLYALGRIACRQCHGLDWSSRHLHRAVPGVHRVARWRRQIGADAHPFSSLPDRPPHHTRFHRIAARIRAEEVKLLEHLNGVVHDLDRRIRVRKAKGKW